jgi:cation diffusion facilitator family transporter
MFATKKGAAGLVLGIVIGLVSIKFAVAAVTGSISILAQAADSFLDLIAVGITFFSIIVAARPADSEHPFGHGKAENISALIQAIFIFIAGSLIIYSAIDRIISGSAIEMTEAGIGVMTISVVTSFLLSRHLLKVSRAEDSPALEGIAHNITADIYSAAGVLVGMVVIRLTGLTIIDPIIALAVALIILKSAYSLMIKSIGGLLDVRLPEDEESIIKSAITRHSNQIKDFHELHTRKSGSQRYINLHIIMHKGVSLEEAHQICNCIERDITIALPYSNTTIHCEPHDESNS